MLFVGCKLNVRAELIFGTDVHALAIKTHLFQGQNPFSISKNGPLVEAAHQLCVSFHAISQTATSLSFHVLLLS